MIDLVISVIELLKFPSSAEGKIDATNFFARSLIRTGEFVQSVEKKKENEAPENP